jgi:YfiH family protein
MQVDESFRLGEDGTYRCQAFQHFIWQSHGFGTRQSSPIAAITLRQIHSDIVRDAHGLRDREREGDALVTNESGLSIGVRTADCVPILLLDSKQRAVGAVHAGWRGSASQIVRCAIHKMIQTFDSEPKNIFAAIGPCVRECCYEVGYEVRQRFGKEGRGNLDLAGENKRQMESAGLPTHQIFDSCLCTCCQIETFYSYRREPQEPGRLLSAITRIS